MNFLFAHAAGGTASLIFDAKPPIVAGQFNDVAPQIPFPFIQANHKRQTFVVKNVAKEDRQPRAHAQPRFDVLLM
jgi:hypothetical protein